VHPVGRPTVRGRARPPGVQPPGAIRARRVRLPARAVGEGAPLDLGLRDRVAAVGGGTAGLGYATAEALLREGAKVVVCSRSAERVQAAVARLASVADPGRVVGLSADLATAEGCERLVGEAESRFGGLDCLLINTGGPPHGHALEADDAAWRAAFELLVLSTVRLTRLAVPRMVARGGGRILAVTSTSVRQPIPDLVLSNSLRAAVVGFLKSAASEYAAHNVLINCLAPGRFATERVAALDAQRAAAGGASPQEVQRASAAAIPAGRYGEAAEYGAVAAFLLSFANTYITGTHVYCDGGLLRTVL
jgi:3-oxoacyl-[acyl-carrier protein] reductase